MSTTAEQQMHQDEFLADLRSGSFRQAFGQIRNGTNARCVLGVAYEQCSPLPSRWDTRTALRQIVDVLGISASMAHSLMRLNDMHLLPFDEIADWFKEERDAYDGDLSEWHPS